MNIKQIRIKNVVKDSLAEQVEIEAGDSLLSIDGHTIDDIFDYQFLTSSELILIEIAKKNGECWEIEIEKDEYEDLGLEFDEELIDKARSCKNKCVFCFIDQLPKGMRETLYFKDDDSRMSFLSGNYITLTNMDDNDIERIIKYRMSPVNISVHTTNSELRKTMLRNKNAGTVLRYIDALVEGGIEVNTQIVLCRGLNDGIELEKTINDLSLLYPGVHSISVVPVGITKYREERGLYNLKPFDTESSLDTIKIVEKLQKQYKKEKGSNIVYLADEFYLMSGKKIPGFKHYEDFPQIENGIGLIASFKYDLDNYLAKLKPNGNYTKNISIATGTAAYEFINECVDKIKGKYINVTIKVYKIENKFFGEKVTVAGLLTGQDIISALQEKELGEFLFIPSSMLKHGEEIFLDDISIEDIERKLKVKVCSVKPRAYDLIDNVRGIK